MKKMTAVLITMLALVGFLAACGGDDDDDATVGSDDTEETTDDASADTGDYATQASEICATYNENKPAITGDSDFAEAADEQEAAQQEAYDALNELDPGDEYADAHEVLTSHFDPQSEESQAVFEALRDGTDPDAIQAAADAYTMTSDEVQTINDAGITCG